MPRDTARLYLDLGIPSICRRLAAARERKQWSKRDLARRASVGEATVAKFENPLAFGEPQLRPALAIVGTLGLTLDGLLGMPAGAAKIPPGEDAIAWILLTHDWTMQHLATETGMSHGTIPAIVAGKAVPDLLTAYAIARAGGVSLDSLARAVLAPTAPAVAAIPAPIIAAADAPPSAPPAAASPATAGRESDRAKWPEIGLSNVMIKRMDRVGGAELILPWPMGLPLPAKPLPLGAKRKATPAEHAAAKQIVGPACAAAGLVPLRSLVACLKRPIKFPRAREIEQHLVVLIIGSRWIGATTTRPPGQCWYREE